MFHHEQEVWALAQSISRWNIKSHNTNSPSLNSIGLRFVHEEAVNKEGFSI